MGPNTGADSRNADSQSASPDNADDTRVDSIAEQREEAEQQLVADYWIAEATFAAAVDATPTEGRPAA